MALFDRFRSRKAADVTKAADDTRTAPPGNTPRKIRLSNASIFFPHWLRGDYTLNNSELLFAAITRISNSLSAMPVQLYRGSTPVKSDLNDLVGFSPNPNMTSCQFFKTMEACRDTYGNAYALKVLGPDMTLNRIDIIDPARVKPIMDKDSGELWYRIDPELGQAYYLHNFYVIHIPFISTNGYTGINPVSVLLNTLSYNEEIQKFSAKQLEKGINAQIVLEAPSNLGEDQQKDMIKEFTETYKETGGNILLLESGVQAKTLNLSPINAELFEVEKISRSRVAMVYNIPPHLLGDYSDVSFSSQEQQMLEFLTLTMLPIVTAYEQELDRKLLTAHERKNKYAFKFTMDSILRADAKTQAEVNYKDVRSAIKTPDEIRAGKGLPGLPGGVGKKAWISKDMAPIDGLYAYYSANPEKITSQGGQIDGEDAD